MPTNQYHEPADELQSEIRTFARMAAGLIEEAEAIDWYEQRISVETDEAARAIMAEAQKEEMRHFSMDLEFLLRQKPEWQLIAKHIIFQDGDILENSEKAEEHIHAEK